MGNVIDLSSEKQKRAAKQATADKVVSQISLLFHDADRVAWANAIIGGHRETFKVESEEMRHYFKREAWRAGHELFGQGLILSKAMVNERIEYLKAKALYDGPEHRVHLRVGEHTDGALYLDMCDQHWRAIRVGKYDWEMIDTPPIFFRRASGMLPLPMPQPGGKIDELRPFLNINPTDFPLVVGWLLAALRPHESYPILVPIGVSGAAKTTVTCVLLRLVDPNSAEVESPPKDLRDLYVTALNRHCLAYDNISRLSQQMSDAYCRMSTGIGGVRRKFYTQLEQVRFPKMARPQILNGIAEFVTEPDLQSRAIMLGLEELKSPKPEKILWQEFESTRPRIFAALLDHLVVGLRNLPNTHLDDLSRMADCIVWCTACGVPNFRMCYEQNLLDATYTVLEGDQLASAIKALMSKRKTPWTGTATQLVIALHRFGFDAENARSLSARIRRLTPPLRKGYQIEVTFLQRKGTARPLRLIKLAVLGTLGATETADTASATGMINDANDATN